MRVLCGIGVVVVLVVLIASGVVAQTSTVHKYDAYGLSVSLPSGCESIRLNDLGGGGMQEAYACNGLGYILIASNDVQPRGASARAVIDMVVQVMDFIKSKDPSIPMHTLTATTSQGVVAKGIALAGGQNSSSKRSYTSVPTELSQRFGANPYVAALLVPIVDRPALLGGVIVVGPPDRSSEVESQVVAVASSIVLSRPTLPEYSSASLYGKNKTGAATPPQPDIKPMSELKKGQIELVGVVKSTDATKKSVDMLVGQAVPFAGHGAVLSPPRLKRVYVKEIAEGVKEGAVIIVVAKDTGPGKAVTADTLTVMDMSKLGF